MTYAMLICVEYILYDAQKGSVKIKIKYIAHRDSYIAGERYQWLTK